MTEDQKSQVQSFLSLIEAEKHKPHPDKKQMRKWLHEIRVLRWEDDYRCVSSGGNVRFLNHTSMRTWQDEYIRQGLAN